MAEKTFTRDQYLKELPEIVKNMDGFRQGSNKSLPVDIHLGDMLQEKYGITQEDYFKAVGFNPKVDTMENIYSMPNPELRWPRSGDCPSRQSIWECEKHHSIPTSSHPTSLSMG